MNLKFKTRIALFNTLAVAVTTALVFLVIYFVVNDTSHSHFDEHIAIERQEIMKSITIQNDSIILSKMSIWYKHSLRRIEVNPLFVQITDKKGKIIFRSANLLNKEKLEKPRKKNKTYYLGSINQQSIRLGWFPITNKNGKPIGELILAISSEGAHNVLNKLIWTLIISFPAVLLILFLASSFAASRAIRPVNRLIRTASRIRDTNINTRLTLPPHKDELYDLTKTLNELLMRIETSMVQQKQFTSDASHEIRTPIAAIRGTLEVLVRKEREPKVYTEKISGIIKEFDRLNTMLDQLLQLARIGSEKMLKRDEKIYLDEIINYSLRKWKRAAFEKDISIVSHVPKIVWVTADRVYLELILDNLTSNAIKYGNNHGNIFFNWYSDVNTLAIQDDGIGIPQEHLPYIFNRFYRADESRSSANLGNGLGLSIVKKLAHIQGIEINAESVLNVGTTFYLQFPY